MCNSVVCVPMHFVISNSQELALRLSDDSKKLDIRTMFKTVYLLLGLILPVLSQQVAYPRQGGAMSPLVYLRPANLGRTRPSIGTALPG